MKTNSSPKYRHLLNGKYPGAHRIKKKRKTTRKECNCVPREREQRCSADVENTILVEIDMDILSDNSPMQFFRNG